MKDLKHFFLRYYERSLYKIKKMIINIILLLIIVGIVIWGGVTSWRFIDKNKDFYENLKRANDTELPILYINLESRKDRRKEIEEEMNKLKNINLVRINAIKIPKNKDEHDLGTSGKIPSGSISCNMSHIVALSVAQNAEWPYVLIVEDDFMWYDANKAQKIIDELIKNNDKWDIVLLSCNGRGKDIKTDLPVKKVVDCQTTSGYLINKRYYATLKDLWVNTLGFRHKNKLFGRTRGSSDGGSGDIVWKNLQKKDTWYMTKPLLGKQRKSFSNIEESVTDYNT